MEALSRKHLVYAALALLGMMFLLKNCGGEDPADARDEFTVSSPGGSDNNRKNKSVDVEADTPKDTVRTLVAHVKKTINRFDKVKQDQEKMGEQQAKLQTNVKTIQSSQKKVGKTLEALTNKIEQLTRKLTHKEVEPGEEASNDTTSAQNGGNFKLNTKNAEIKIANERQHSNKPQYVSYQDQGQLKRAVKLVRHTPGSERWVRRYPHLKTHATQGSGQGSGQSTNTGPILKRQDAGQRKQRSAGSVPYYTIPENTTLVNAVLFTGLLGRIPVNGVVDDPYPFTVLIARANLAAMGFKIPGIRGMIMRGKAKGDLNLSCVSGNIVSATFIFEDGTIKTLHGDSAKPLAVLEDRQGLPCVPGKLITNAGKFLTIRAILGGIEGAAQAGAATETTSSVSNVTGGATTAVTGDKKKFMLNTMGARAAGETSSWWNSRMKQSFDVIFVRPGVKVSLMIMREMRIDLDKGSGARKVVHREQRRLDAYKQSGMD